MITKRTAALFAAVTAFALAQAASAAPAPRNRTLDNSGDPTLALTGPLGGAAPAPEGSPPPNPDPHNLEGVWWLKGYEYMLGPEPGVEPPLKPKYMELLKKRIREKNAGRPEADSASQCFPHGMPRLMESPYPIEIVQTPGQVTFLHEVAHNIRRIYLDRPAPRNQPLTWLGYSEGHWDGDTLVVTTTRINDRTFIDDEGSSKSTSLKTIERYRKIDGGKQLELTMTIDDPVTLEHPYSYKRYYQWRSDTRPMEYICEENNRNAPVNGVTVAQ
jgi:hypothetical protein